MSNGIAGKNGSFRIGGTAYKVTEWTISTACEYLDDSNSKSGGKEEGVAGFKSATGTFAGNLDLSDNPIASVEPGTGVTLQLYVDGSQKIEVPCIITQFDFNMPVKGMVTWSGTFRANGWDTDEIVNIA